MAMAHNQAPAFFVAAALLLLAAAAPPAVAQSLSPQVPPQLNVNGVLTCPVGGGPIPNVTVTLSCAIPGVGSGSGAIFSAGQSAQSITGPNGQFAIIPLGTGTTLVGLLNGGCLLSTPLPINRTVCAALSTINGTLVGVVSQITNILPGNILNVTGSLNIRIPNILG